MGIIDRLLEAVGQDQAASSSRRPKGFRRLMHVLDFGPGRIEVLVGDMDGSGEAPGVQITIEHVHLPGGTASIALSASETEDLSALLLRAANAIPPSERLRVTRKRLKEGRKS